MPSLLLFAIHGWWCRHGSGVDVAQRSPRVAVRLCQLGGSVRRHGVYGTEIESQLEAISSKQTSSARRGARAG